MTVTLEKIFFNYILKNKVYIPNVLASFFKNVDIQFVYGVVREYMTNNPSSDIPSPKQLYEMISLKDIENNIKKDTLKNLLKSDLDQYDEVNFVKKNLHSWILANKIKNGTSLIIDETRKMDENFDIVGAFDIAEKIKTITLDSTSTIFIEDEDLGSDFDNAESHSQDHSVTKIKTGFNSLDSMTNGGFDRATLSLALGKTNAGKSIFLQNLTAAVANQGYNVVYFTLEMSERKVLKRLGSMRLKIPINKYDELSIDSDFIKSKIDALKNNKEDELSMFTKDIGKVMVKFFAAGTATVDHLEGYLKKLHDKKGVKPDFIVVDYINLMTTNKGTAIESNLYQKGKLLAEGLRAMAAKYNCPLVTVTQLAKDAWDANDITLQDIPESKAIAEACDLMLGLIVTDELKLEGKLRIKLLKQRDGDFSNSNAMFKINNDYLSYEDDHLI